MRPVLRNVLSRAVSICFLLPVSHVIITKMDYRNTVRIVIIAILLAGLCGTGMASDACVLSVTSIPDEATIRIDGLQKGMTPLGLSLSCGEHMVQVEKPGYLPSVMEISLVPQEHRDLLVNLERHQDRGPVMVRSQPAGAVVFINNVELGVTPLRIDNLLYGRHPILLRKDGYLDYRDVVTAGPGAVHEYMEYLVPEPTSGFLSIASVPAGASVSVDGRAFGITPTRLERVSAGNRTVTVIKDGYLNYTVVTEVPAAQSVLVKADLTRIPDTGMIIVDSVPTGADVFLNGTFKGITPAVFENVPQGHYDLVLGKRNYSGLNSVLTLFGGETHELFAVFSSGADADTPGFITENVYTGHSNASRLKPGMVDPTPSMERTYTWYDKGHETTVRLRIPQELYDYYKEQPHLPQTPEEYKRYAITERDRAYLHDLIGLLKDSGENKHLSARSDYRNAVSFVQSLVYEKDLDPVTSQETEYWKYPIETLADGSGDCEDTAILTAALLRELGYDVALVLLSDHAAVAVACDTCNGYYYPLDGKRYYYLETTGAGYALGTIDQTQYQTSAARVIPLESREVIE